MGRSLATCKYAALVFTIVVATAASAVEPLKPMGFNGRYAIRWSGVTLGRILIQAHEDAKSYRMSIDTKTKGLGALISDEKRIVEGAGSKTETGGYLPARYNSRPQKDLDEDEVTLTYNTLGKLIKRERKNDDNPAWRPAISTEEADTAHDPVTGAFVLRRALYESLARDKNEVSLRTYDGLRLANMRLIPSTTESRMEIMDEYKPIVSAVVKREPINGYTPKELKKYRKGDPEIRIFFTDDAAFLPVRASAKTAIGELSMTLEKFE